MVNKKEAARKTAISLAIMAAIMYVMTGIILLHCMIVMEDDSSLTMAEGITLGMRHMATRPFEILPLPNGYIGNMLLIAFIGGLAALMLYLDAQIKKHDNPDTVLGGEKILSDLRLYNKRFSDPIGKTTNDGPNNVILCKELYMAMANEVTKRNLNALIIGGSGSGKSFMYIGPNILQMNASFVVTDPSGGLCQGYGKILEYMGYHVKCFNISNMDKGNHYNPFNYIHSDKDIEILVTTLISNTTPPDKKGGDPFWEKSETALLVALIAYLYHYTDKRLQNFSNVMRLLRAAEIDENDSTQKSPLDDMFDEVAQKDPDGFAINQYKTFKMGAGKTLKSILISCATRLQAFDLEDVMNLTDTDDIDLDSIGDEKTALFIILPTGEKTFNFLASMMYSQLFQRLYGYAETSAEYSQIVMDSDHQVVKTFRADSPNKKEKAKKDAKSFFKRAKAGTLLYNEYYDWWEVRTAQNELVLHRGSKEEAEKAFVKLKHGSIVDNATRENHGQRLPIHVRLLLDEFANIGKIPDFPEKVATIRKYELSVSIVLQSLTQLKNLYKDNWEELSGNCDATLYLGGGADTSSTKWISELLGKETRIVMNTSFSKGGGSTSYNRQGVELISPAELRTMDEDKCVIFIRSLPGYMGYKYKATEHPMWPLKQKLGSYYFNPELSARLLADSKNLSAENEIRQIHGNPVQEDEESAEAREAGNRMREQRAEEYKNNKDANGESLIGDPESANDKEGFGARTNLTKPEQIPEMIDETLSATEEAWNTTCFDIQARPRKA